MSDKSFGDHTSRNTVKNPLLSTAVTGLSLEDLTHKAVLLPVAPTQGLITRPDQQSGSQTHTLANPDHETTIFPSGDAQLNIAHFHSSADNKPNILDSQNVVKHEKVHDTSSSVQSKATVKSEDDFDVNEYFARLQGTRYVSAPLHSHLKDDQNAHLDATEENLEEINLNESQSNENQQSLTADIAQNFSQLPTVLPHVASAVFSSFSNMLNLKSREQTPDEAKTSKNYQNVQVEKPEDVAVPLMGMDDGSFTVKDVAPPPKDPPIGGTGNYRITTKKKAYAQIPGLNSGDRSQNITYNAPVDANRSYFVPTEAFKTVEPATEASSDNLSLNAQNLPKIQTEAYNICNPVPSDKQNVVSLEATSESQPNVFANVKHNEENLFAPIGHKSEQGFLQSHDVTAPIPSQGTAPIIPPPPMFSNLPKRESNPSKSILPPSVARRIAPNHPILKPQAMPPLSLSENIFVPTPVDDNFIFDATPMAIQPSPSQKCAPNLPPTNILPSQIFASTNAPPNIQSPSIYNVSQKPPMFSPISASASLLLEHKDAPAPDLSSATIPMMPAANIKNVHPQSMFLPIMQQTLTAAESVVDAKIFASTTSTLNIESTSSNINVLSNIGSPTSVHASTIPQTEPTFNVPPTVTFFNPNTLAQSVTAPQETPQKDLQKPSQLFAPTALTSEHCKRLVEPPKIAGNLNYRMTKKRPQYYCGPIEGIGAITNNIKPIVPPLGTITFDDSLFTPQEQEPSAQTADPYVVPFYQFELFSPYGSIPTIDPNARDYDTAFDLSRSTTDSYEEPKQESKGFGIIGSLKSKLSSIDINKIQSSVTTFFDHAYYDSNKDESTSQENAPYRSLGQYSQNNSSFDVFVPNVDQASQSSHTYDYQTNQNAGYNYQYYQTQDAYNYYHPSSSYYSDVINTPAQKDSNNELNTDDQTNLKTTAIHAQDNIPDVVDDFSKNNVSIEYVDITTEEKNAKLPENVHTSMPETKKEHLENIMQTETELSSNIFFDNPQLNLSQSLVLADELNEKLSSLTLSKDTANMKSKNENEKVDIFRLESTLEESTNILPESTKALCDSTGSLFNNPIVTTAGGETFANFEPKDKDSKRDFALKETNLLESLSKDDIPIVAVSTVPLFGLSTIIAEKPTESSHLENNMKNVSIFETAEENKNIPFNRNTSSFFEYMLPTENKQIAEESHDENAPELNICETCREVNIPEEKESDDLTAQLIENITSPIQLSNPVEVPLTESDEPMIGTIELDNNQCAEILHITEETMETIQVQSATELLDDDIPSEISANVRDYGWVTEEPNYSLKSLLDHEFGFKLDTNSIGFYGNNSLFFDDVPNNASDEIKAEFQSTHEETILPRQMSIPSAPPAEDDLKSDEAGLDVHSIEQDAKKDFPIYEEFVIEPSETDDVKIEFKERERSSEDPIAIDTFTNRVERFKKEADDTIDDEAHKKSNIVKNNPAISMASYFDTGNYAAETHYRNSLSSPSTLYAFPIGTSSVAMRIPPGFEDEYKRRLSGISIPSIGDKNDKDNVTVIPETSTQTRPILTPTYSSAQHSKTEYSIGFQIETNLTKLVDETKTEELETERLPAFSTIFGAHKDVEQEKETKVTPPVFAESKTVVPKEEIVKPEQIAQSLPDPINFFSSNDEPKPAAETDVPENNFNRLASYFFTPTTKPDHAKSFFELSQSQNHYRHDSGQDKKIAENDDKDQPKSFFELSQSQDHYTDDTQNTKYIANLNLMKELTSCQNLHPDCKDQIVRTVNYFTVELDNNKNNIDFNKVEQNVGSNLKIDTKSSELVESCNNEEQSIESIIKNCIYCCDINSVCVTNPNIVDIQDYKVRKSMNDTHERRPDTNRNMDDKDNGRKTVTVDFENYTVHEEPDEGITVLTESRTSTEYLPVNHHWFYRVDVEDKSVWRGFSAVDSRALEDAFLSPELNEHTLVPTDGGRYDVNVVGRLRIAVYWKDKPTNVRRCSWFYKGTTDARYVPYTEPVAEKLEVEYRHGMTTGEWHRRLVLPNNELVVMHGPSVMVHFLHTGSNDPFSSPTMFTFGKRVYRNPLKICVSRDQPERIDHLILLVHGAGEYRNQKEKTQSTSRPRVVRRGHDESEIEDTEPSSIDHLLLLCHGVGSACDMRFRSVEEVVEDFRTTSLQLLQSHYKNSYDNGIVSRVEVLPISWHETLHSGETGVDRRLAQITLDSIPRLRNFTNDTVLDVLFYTSPVFCQTILDTVCTELNRIYDLFKKRNPKFYGGISLGGHSLGSVILYDLLCHQTPEVNNKSNVSSAKKYVRGSVDGLPTIKYPKLSFSPAAMYALGSPIAIFECIRGVESLGADFGLPTCKNFFNIFHPYDPIAYRIEPLINPKLRDVKPYLIPHHKGRKRMHLELKETMARVGADLKQKLMESLRTTWNKWKAQPQPTDGQLEKVVEEIEKEQLCDDKEDQLQNDLTTPDMLGKLNGGRRIDYVLQEAPLEMINEYLFAMSSHVGYWESEDTMLLMLREIYDALGVQPDSTIPQQSMTVQRTRTTKQDDISNGTTDYPSTSRGGV